MFYVYWAQHLTFFEKIIWTLLVNLLPKTLYLKLISLNLRVIHLLDSCYFKEFKILYSISTYEMKVQFYN